MGLIAGIKKPDSKFVCIHCLDGLTFEDSELIEKQDLSKLTNSCIHCENRLIDAVKYVQFNLTNETGD